MEQIPACDEFLPPIDAETLLAKELSKLSVKDREQVFYDMHGVSEAVEETPTLITESLSAMESEILKIPEQDAYQKAKSQNQAYVDDPKLHLKFLRAERFKTEPAAARLVKFFEVKRNLFGDEMLTKDIRFSDLEESDRRCVESGISQILPLRDRAGRVVAVWLPMLRGDSSLPSRVS